MGLSKWAQNKIKEKVHEYQANRAEEKGFRREVAEEAKQERRRGYAEGYKKTAYKQGVAAAQGRSNPQGVTGVVSKVGKFGDGMGKGIQGFGDTFLGKGGGFGGGGLGSGIAWGNDAPRKPTGPPMRTRTISPSGKVTITEPIQPQQRTEQQWDPWGTTPARKKGEKHPYDVF